MKVFRDEDGGQAIVLVAVTMLGMLFGARAVLHGQLHREGPRHLGAAEEAEGHRGEGQRELDHRLAGVIPEQAEHG
ncbi:MAG: hypothetical protein FJ034_07560 [Chloroflexi bacterium]|nr:hypothetical protein [Chloroflexota bacterium]